MSASPENDVLQIAPIAHIKTDFPTKFGLPRQSGLVENLKGKIIFTSEYRDASALRGLEGFSHIWLIWGFSEAKKDTWSPTVRPPKLGGNVRVGVFATRSPFRPNPIALSCVQLESIELNTPDGPIITVSGIDLMDGTPIYDIKPYLPYADSRPDAAGGFATNYGGSVLEVIIPEDILAKIPAGRRAALRGVLAQDPRPAYHTDPERVYGFEYAGMEVKFTVSENTVTVVSVCGI